MGTAAAPAYERPRVLLVDDSPIMRQIVAVMLPEEAFDVAEAGGGTLALELLREEPYDLVITDLNMAQGDGLTFVRALRTLEAGSARARTPVIVLTGHAGAIAGHTIREAGADRHLEKPVLPAPLLTAVAELMEAR
jgi:CheY-like chemotaxis protein